MALGTLSIIGLIGTGIGTAFKGISSGIQSSRQKKALQAQADQMKNLVNQYRDLVESGGMDLDSALERIGAHFGAVGGKLNEHFKEQMRLGTEQINSRLKSTMDQIQFGIDRAKSRADRSERNFLEDEEKKLKQLSKDFDKSNQQLKNTAVQRRLGASGAMIAALNTAQETYGKIQKDMAESKSKFFRGIGEQFADVVQAGGFQSLQAQAQAGREGLGLQQQIGGQKVQAETNLAQQQFAAGEAARERSLDIAGGELALLQQQQGLQTQADATSPFANVFGDLAGGVTELGSSLLGAGIKQDLATPKT